VVVCAGWRFGQFLAQPGARGGRPPCDSEPVVRDTKPGHASSGRLLAAFQQAHQLLRGLAQGVGVDLWRKTATY